MSDLYTLTAEEAEKSDELSAKKEAQNNGIALCVDLYNANMADILQEERNFWNELLDKMEMPIEERMAKQFTVITVDGKARVVEVNRQEKLDS